MMATIYTMSTTTPGSWQQFIEVLRANPGIAIRDLRPPGEVTRFEEPPQWGNVQQGLYIEGPGEMQYSYSWPGLFLPERMHIPVRRLASLLQRGHNVICFDRNPLAAESLRQQVAEEVLEQAPQATHEELAWQNTPLRDEPKLVRFLCTVYGYLQEISRVEVELEAPSRNDYGLRQCAREVRVYGLDGSQRLPDLNLPYWQTILDSYSLLFTGDTTVEQKIRSALDMLAYEREYQESGLVWSTSEGQELQQLLFDFSPLTVKPEGRTEG